MPDIRNFKKIVNPDGTPADDGATIAVDQLHRPLRLGDILILSPEVQVPFTVAAARKVLDPRAPAGTEEIVLQAEFPFVAIPGRTVVVPGTRVMTAAESEARARVGEPPPTAES